MPSRRQFPAASAGAIAATLNTSEVQATHGEAKALSTNLVSLCGEWLFRTDSADSGTSQHWYDTDVPGTSWRPVNVPHTWQIEAPLAEYYGTTLAWKRRMAMTSSTARTLSNPRSPFPIKCSTEFLLRALA